MEWKSSCWASLPANYWGCYKVISVQQAKDFFQSHKTVIVIGAAVVLVGCAYFIGRHNAVTAVREGQPLKIPQELLDSVNALQNKLDISEQNANLLKTEIQKIQAGKTAPTATYYVTAPTVERAADVVQEQIKNNDPTLPPAALEKTDRTVVTPITKDGNGDVLPADKQKVEVYKIDLRKDHRIKAGATIVDGKAYESIGYEQKRLEAIAHLQGKDVKGATVMWTVAQW